jgi:hypothetical protein
MHLLFKCAQCSEPLWELVGGGNYFLDKACLPDSTNILDTFMVQYTTLMMGRSHSGMLQVMASFQVIKRDLIYCRFKRCMTRAIQPDRTRLLRYLRCMLAIQLSGRKCRGAEKLQGLLHPIDITNPPPTAISGTFLTLTPTQPIITIGAKQIFAQEKCTHHNS